MTCRVCGQPVDAFRRSHLPAPEVCDKCDPSRDQGLAWIEEMEPGAVLVVEELKPLHGGHDPRRRPEQRITIDSTVLYDIAHERRPEPRRP